MLLAAALALAPQPLAYRWLYLQTNLFREEEVAKIERILDRAGKAGYNGAVLTDTKLQSQDPLPDFYQARLARVLAAGKRNGIRLVPMAAVVGYAEGMLAHEPSLVEAVEARDVPFLVRGSEASLAPDPEVAYRNGDFETTHGDRFTGFDFQDGIGITTFADRAVRHGGTTSLRIDNPGQLKDLDGNCRVMQTVTVRPNRHYRFSAWVRTERFARAGSVRLAVLDETGRPLSFLDAHVRPDQDWTEHQVTFNSRANAKARLYIGVWSGTTGRMWIDDAKLEEVGLTNLVRRPGCPIRVTSANGTPYQEGRDFAPLADPKSGQVPWPGSYDVWHPSPSIKLLPGTQIKQGETLRVTFSHALLTDGTKTAICLTEPATRALQDREIAKLLAAFDGTSLVLGHDEIRALGNCPGCLKTGKTPGQILANDVAASLRTLKKARPTAEAFAWSDMFDPHHNAVKDYYHVPGDLKGSWEGLTKDVVIVNWNSGRPTESLPFFANRGHRQILAGYYDGRPEDIQPWLKEAAKVKGVVGVMYTTWADRYEDLEAFAKAAWGKP